MKDWAEDHRLCILGNRGFTPNLARIELELSLRALRARDPKLELDPEKLPVRKCDSLAFRGFARLPVRAGQL
ncbi:MAG: hypothetical protein EXS09_15960 [Gemmataceae bacterium]|nr:hypothetical protein [Gemmataceae bacterium]